MDPVAAGYSFEVIQDRYLEEQEDDAPLLTAEEEMQYQRALWVNRLLKEQLAAQTQGLSIEEIEEAQAQIQARMRGAQRMEAWPVGGQAPIAETPRRMARPSPRVPVKSSSVFGAPPSAAIGPAH